MQTNTPRRFLLQQKRILIFKGRKWKLRIQRATMTGFWEGITFPQMWVASFALGSSWRFEGGTCRGQSLVNGWTSGRIWFHYTQPSRDARLQSGTWGPLELQLIFGLQRSVPLREDSMAQYPLRSLPSPSFQEFPNLNLRGVDWQLYYPPKLPFLPGGLTSVVWRYL